MTLNCVRFQTGLLVVTFLVSLMHPLNIYAKTPQPQVTALNPGTVTPGATVTISGNNLTTDGMYDGCDRMVNGKLEDYSCPFKAVVGAYKEGRSHIGGGMPNFRFAILSATGKQATVQAPASIPSGNGMYNVAWFWEFSAKDWPIQAGQLMGFARYDPITVSGAGAAPPASAAKPEYTPSPFPKQSESPAPTVTESPAKTETPGGTDADTSPVSLPEQPESVNSTEKSLPMFIRSLLTFLKSIFMPGR